MNTQRYNIKKSHKLDENNITDESEESIEEQISTFLGKIKNKYSGNVDQKYLNQMYDIGIMIANKNFNEEKLVKKLTKIVTDRSYDPIKRVRDHKKKSLLDALKKGIDDGLSEEYRYAYDSSNKYRYDSETLKKRARIDSVLDNL